MMLFLLIFDSTETDLCAMRMCPQTGRTIFKHFADADAIFDVCECGCCL